MNWNREKLLKMHKFYTSYYVIALASFCINLVIILIVFGSFTGFIFGFRLEQINNTFLSILICNNTRGIFKFKNV